MKNHLRHSVIKCFLALISISFLSPTLSSAQNTEGNYHAIFIAIDSYNSDLWKPLKNPVSDATDIQEVLKEKYGFKTITNIFNEEATRTNILEKLDKVTSSLSENDHLLIYYTGHGIEIGTDGYWVPFEAKSKERYELLSTTEIKNAVGATKSKHVLVLVDACFSSTILKSASSSLSNDGSSNYYNKIEKLLSRQAMTAGGLEPVMDGSGENSIFAKYIVKFLDKNPKPTLTAGELFELVKYPIAANSPNTPQFGHLQNTGHEGGEFVFRIQGKQICDHKAYFQEGQAIDFDSEGGVVTIKTTANNSRFVWKYNGTTINNKSASLNVSKSGIYAVSVITDNNCVTDASIEVKIGTPTVTIDILEGKKIEFTHKGKLNASVTGYSNTVDFEWKKGNFVMGKTSSLEITETGNYTVIIKSKSGEELGRKTSFVTIKNRVYNVAVGDNVERIARSFYGDANKADVIYNANPTLKKGEVLRVGTKVIIPNIKREDELAIINIGTAQSFAPFSQETWHNGGMLTDIVSNVYSSMGKKAAINYVPNVSLKGLTFNGRAEVSYPLTKNQADERLFKFSNPLYSTLTVFFAAEGTAVVDMEATMKKRMRKNKYQALVVAIPSGFSSDQLTKYYENKLIILKPMADYESCFLALKNGEVDLVAAPQITGLVTIKSSKTLNRADFQILDKAIETTTLHLVVSKEHPEADEMIETFNRALAKAKEEGTINKIIDSHIDLIQNGQP